MELKKSPSKDKVGEAEMTRSRQRRREFGAWAGILAPVIFVGAFTLLGLLRPAYEPLKMYVSALSLGPDGWIQQVNFILLGLLMLLFAYGLRAEFPSGKASKGGIILLAIMGVLFIVSGPFVMDPQGTPQAQATVHGTIHGLAGGIIFILMPITCFVFLRRFRADPAWRSFYWWTLVLGIVVAAAVIMLSVVSKQASLIATFQDWFGLIQRFIIIPFMLWIFLFGVWLYRRSYGTN